LNVDIKITEAETIDISHVGMKSSFVMGGAYSNTRISIVFNYVINIFGHHICILKH